MVYDDLPILNSDFLVRYVKLAEGCIQPKKHPVSRISQDLSGSFSRESSSDFKKKAWWVEGILHCSHEYCLGEIGAVSEDLIWKKRLQQPSSMYVHSNSHLGEMIHHDSSLFGWKSCKISWNPEVWIWGWVNIHKQPNWVGERPNQHRSTYINEICSWRER